VDWINVRVLALVWASCENGDEPLGYVSHGELLELLNDC
jgi:hypothetical protein